MSILRLLSIVLVRRGAKRKLCAFIALLSLIITLLSVLAFPDSSIMFGQPVVCDYGETMRKNLLSITVTVEHVLSVMKINYFACYGTLWAIVRRNQIAFPWSNSVQLCVLNEQLDKVDEGLLQRYFKRFNLDVRYDGYEGVYTVTNTGDSTGQTGSVQIILFERVPQPEYSARYHSSQLEYRRIGVRNRLLPPDSEMVDKFPARLIDAPLPMKTASQIEIAVPHENFEMQKYLYKNNWWLEKKPTSC